MLPVCTFRLALLLVPAPEALVVARVPVKMPVLTPVSVSVTTSVSPVALLVTVTLTLCAVPALVLRSASVAVSVMLWPATTALRLVVPVMPASLSRPVVTVVGTPEVNVPSYFTPVPSSLMVAVPVASLVDSVLVAVPPVTVWSASVALSWNVSLLSTAASCSPVISTLTNIFPAASKVGSALVAS